MVQQVKNPQFGSFGPFSTNACIKLSKIDEAAQSGVTTIYGRIVLKSARESQFCDNLIVFTAYLAIVFGLISR